MFRMTKGAFNTPLLLVTYKKVQQQLSHNMSKINTKRKIKHGDIQGASLTQPMVPKYGRLVASRIMQVDFSVEKL